jgi:hypothetical protein
VTFFFWIEVCCVGKRLPSFCGSAAATAQGARKRAPLASPRFLVLRQNYCPLPRVPSSVLRAVRTGTDTLPAWLYLSRASCPLTRPSVLVGNNLMPPPPLQILCYVRKE